MFTIVDWFLELELMLMLKVELVVKVVDGGVVVVMVEQ